MGITELYHAISQDSWRQATPFSKDIREANEALLRSLAAGESAEALAKPLRRWLQLEQPCLFGRFAAGNSDLLSFCILTESDIDRGDLHVRDKIRDARTAWKKAAAAGKKSGFIIAAVSKKLLEAAPDERLKEFARRLGSLYLRVDTIEDDQACTDDLFLDVPVDGDDTRVFKWRVGVNFFGAQGDGRWWHDHRIPGGIAFSMNSVGHMARSGELHNIAPQAPVVDAAARRKVKLPVDSLSAALRYAMLTINNAQDTASGKATCLRDLSSDEYAALTPKCPISNPQKELEHKDYRSYLGWYDTDATLPSSYFRPEVERPKDVKRIKLWFDYLFDDNVENSDFDTMGGGERIRGSGGEKKAVGKSTIWGTATSRDEMLRHLG